MSVQLYGDSIIPKVTSIIIRSPCILQNQQSLHDTVQSSDVVTVCRGTDKYEDLPTKQLVPGDVIIIPPHGCDMHCDAVLLSGTCIVNESMLTGRRGKRLGVLGVSGSQVGRSHDWGCSGYLAHR
jgi:magnesium-transporting ATPase (P-type)